MSTLDDTSDWSTDDWNSRAMPFTPKSEWHRPAVEMSMQTLRTLCKADRKCVRKQGHAGDCWPKEN